MDIRQYGLWYSGVSCLNVTLNNYPVRHINQWYNYGVWKLLNVYFVVSRQTDRQTDRQAGKQAGRKTDREAGRQAGRQGETDTDRQIDRQTDRERQIFVKAI